MEPARFKLGLEGGDDEDADEDPVVGGGFGGDSDLEGLGGDFDRGRGGDFDRDVLFLRLEDGGKGGEPPWWDDADADAADEDTDVVDLDFVGLELRDEE